MPAAELAITKRAAPRGRATLFTPLIQPPLIPRITRMDITGMDILSITRAMGVIPTIMPVIIGPTIMVATGIQVTTIRPLPSLDIVLLTSTEPKGHHTFDPCRAPHSLA